MKIQQRESAHVLANVGEYAFKKVAALTVQRPQTPIVAAPRNMTNPREATDFVLYERKALMVHEVVKGTNRGCPGAAFVCRETISSFGTCKTLS